VLLRRHWCIGVDWLGTRTGPSPLPGVRTPGSRAGRWQLDRSGKGLNRKLVYELRVTGPEQRSRCCHFNEMATIRPSGSLPDARRYGTDLRSDGSGRGVGLTQHRTRITITSNRHDPSINHMDVLGEGYKPEDGVDANNGDAVVAIHN